MKLRTLRAALDSMENGRDVAVYDRSAREERTITAVQIPADDTEPIQLIVEE